MDKGLEMVNYNLAASDNVVLGQAPSANQLVNNKASVLRQALTVAKRIDRRAQIFFNAQASTRGRKAGKTQWGIDRHAGF